MTDAQLAFYLGTHMPNWLAFAEVPLFVSHRRLAGRRSLPRAATGWALDSGGFSELSLYGEWLSTPREYAAAVHRYDAEIGQLNWAAPQDWMCEPIMLARTGLSVAEHQRRTVDNLLQLRDLWTAASDAPFMPVLQGWALDDYLRCADLYEQAGVDLTAEPVVGIGSVCRRQSTDEIATIVAALHRHLDPGHDAENNLHGFGVKTRGLHRYGHLLGSADSMAWSFDARRAAPLAGHEGDHKNCANCLPYALTWRERVIAA